MRALLIGAVEGTRVAMNAIAGAQGWDLAGLLTLSPALAARHSDYVDLREQAAALGAQVILASSGNEAATIAAVEQMKPDLSFVIGWSQLCSEALVAAAGGRMVGYHPAPLPRLRGRAAIPWTILLNEPISASTLFWVSDDVDEGPILAQDFFHLAPDETATTLYAKHMSALRRMLDGLLPQMLTGLPPGRPQEHHLATWGARRRPDDGLIDWRKPAAEIDRLIRATTRPYPGAFTFAGEDRIALWGCAPPATHAAFHAAPGQVVARTATGFAVMCGDGGLVQIADYTAAAGGGPRLHAILGEAGS